LHKSYIWKNKVLIFFLFEFTEAGSRSFCWCFQKLVVAWLRNRVSSWWIQKVCIEFIHNKQTSFIADQNMGLYLLFWEVMTRIIRTNWKIFCIWRFLFAFIDMGHQSIRLHDMFWIEGTLNVICCFCMNWKIELIAWLFFDSRGFHFWPRWFFWLSAWDFGTIQFFSLFLLFTAEPSHFCYTVETYFTGKAVVKWLIWVNDWLVGNRFV
jgi:hypothetical protein